MLGIVFLLPSRVPGCPGSLWLMTLQMSSFRKSLEVHEFDGHFLGQAAHFKMTAVIGHVLSIDFPHAYQSWETTDPASLFSAPTVKNEANPKVSIHSSQAKLLYPWDQIRQFNGSEVAPRSKVRLLCL